MIRMKEIALVLVLVPGVVGQTLAQGGGGPAPVAVDQVEVVPMATTILVPGTVVSRNDAELAAEVDGRLIQVADIGTRVAAGDVVARIEDTVLKLRRTEQAALVEREQAQLRYLTREEQRLAALAERNVGAKNQLDQTRSQRDMARGDLAVAKSRLAQIDDQLERTGIRAPFEGVVVERLSRVGERVTVGTRVVRLVDPNHLEVIARAPLEYYRFLDVGDLVRMTAAGEALEGRLRTRVAVGDENTHLFEVRIDVPGGILPVGQTIRVTLPASQPREVLSVHRDALVLRPDGISVFVIDAGNKAHRVDVTTGLASGERIEVRGAVEPGDRVVIRGNERLREGQSVAVDGAAAATAAN